MKFHMEISANTPSNINPEAERIFRLYYKGDVNALTPQRLEVDFVPGKPNIVYELSSGKAMFRGGQTVYAITSVVYDPATDTAKRLQDYTAGGFVSAQDVRDLIKEMSEDESL
ncbi:hypothetical protein PV783_33915 [Chitinophaga sp. CC14]|uniref:hypothetical protein n=1 Tax=Chitinophaga sp. CC14 TaxID=3029199 RepID=UPI003B81D211